jgi:DNA-directed RNA polymerase subunit M/transcription elongation factor TFIIS
MSQLLEKNNPVIFRANISKQLSSLFPNCKIEKLGENIEKSVFNFAIKEATNNQIIKKWQNPLFCEIYHSRLRAIYINLKRNEDLRNQLKNGEINMNQFAFMTHQEMNPLQWKDRIERKIKRDRLKFTNNVKASTDMFTCGRCKSKQCTYYEMQTRSADEPTTVFITCLNCGKNWKN